MSATLQEELAYLLRETGRDEASILAEAVQEGVHALFCKYVQDAYIEGKVSHRRAVRLLGSSAVDKIDAAWRSVEADVKWGMKA